MSLFDERDHRRLARLFNGTCDKWGDPERLEPGPRTPYAGYKPDVAEAPNGDTKECQDCGGSGRVPIEPDSDADCATCEGTGRVPNTDAGKRYLHVADKYGPPAWAREYQDRAYAEACRVADALRVPDAFYPRPGPGALRVLEYPPGAGTVEHTDANLFTILLWRSTPEDLERQTRTSEAGTAYLDLVSPGLHIGEIGELVGLGPATPHRVPARPYAQKSIVYFAIPSHEARLPCDHACMEGEWCPKQQTVREWLAERMKRSRY